MRRKRRELLGLTTLIIVTTTLEGVYCEDGATHSRNSTFLGMKQLLRTVRNA
jgi:hypothetical protein